MRTPKKITRPEHLPSEWAAVTLSPGAEVAPKHKQPMTVFDSRARLCHDSYYRPYFVHLVPFVCRVLVRY